MDKDDVKQLILIKMYTITKEFEIKKIDIDNDLFTKVISEIILLNKCNMNKMILNNYILQFYNK